jgi:hypothetical protein
MRLAPRQAVPAPVGIGKPVRVAPLALDRAVGVDEAVARLAVIAVIVRDEVAALLLGAVGVLVAAGNAGPLLTHRVGRRAVRVPGAGRLKAQARGGVALPQLLRAVTVAAAGRQADTGRGIAVRVEAGGAVLV